MSNLENKLLGEKRHYYCSSSEEEGEEESSEVPLTNRTNSKDRYSSNTGPKGVIKDWQRYKQLESELRDEKERDKVLLMEKLSMKCQTEAEEEKEKQRAEEEEFESMINESEQFINEYMKKRMVEMYEHNTSRIIFAHLFQLTNGQQFLDAIDKERPNVTIIVHVFSHQIPACHQMNRVLQSLASIHPYVKFCSVEASSAGLSERFERTGVPALLVYKSGNLVGNFVRIMGDLSEDFDSDDVQGFLIERGFLPDPSLVPEIIKDSSFVKNCVPDDSENEEEN